MHTIPPANRGLVRQALLDIPRPDLIAKEKLQTWLAAQGITDSPLDIDVITFHYQTEPLGEGRAYTQDNAVITQKMNLVEALLANWQGESAAGYGGFHYGNWAGIAPTGPVKLVERLEPLGLFSNASPYLIFNGLYRRTQAARYAPDTRLPVRAEDFQSYLWNLHFHTDFKSRLDTYWQRRQVHYQRALKIAFIAACNRQVQAGSLSADSQLAIWRAAGLTPRQDVRTTMLNIYGYVSSSIVQISQASRPQVILYIPGNLSPFHEFASATAMQQWLAAQCRESDKRAALLGHFARADWPDGLEFSGLRTALDGLGLYPRAHRLSAEHPGFATSGFWKPENVINFRPEKYSPPIEGDLFQALTQLQKQRAYADADSQITSNHEIDKARWGSYLNLMTTLLAPLVIVLPELSPLLLAGGVGQFGLGLDAAINGKDLQQREQGLSEQVFGLFNALPGLGNIVARPASVFAYARRGFFSSKRLAELLEVPVGAAPQVQELELEPAELAFREPVIVSAQATSTLVARIDERLYARFAAWLRTDRGIINDWVQYEVSSDSFIRIQDARLPEPTRWIIQGDGEFALVATTSGPRISNNAQRMATLRGLGIDLQLPLDLQSFTDLQRTAIPQVVSSVWLGDQPLQGEFLEALTHNAQALQGTAYRYQVFLSRENHAVYQGNLRLLRRQAPNALLMPLEDQGFFHDFARSPYYRQYRDAIEGNGGLARNFSSACDVLRYRLLKHYGGLYLDADDRLLLASDAQAELPLQRIELKTTQDGLVLSPPVSNDLLGMHIKFNSSMIGSHPGNPTLDAISERILQRYAQTPAFYRTRPDPILQPLPFRDYARKLSLISGPGVLNDVIDERLPWLRQLREVCNLMASPIHDIAATVDFSELTRALREHVPLDRVAKMGQAHSWAA
ncbi:dermonecrotic toxin domain-containing protein [Pseudomonas monteilii]|uniref:dermonecrotic toxin domain-containing protein n=1 Tax=Pseudomonas monteilii TaxID=76759 RepID=UPI0018AA1EE6|nr:DUF6543 domain-containing protein [Pseudomonas monteilii]MBF8745373.1 mannosyltransferase [Pseudomonas monteilii]